MSRDVRGRIVLAALAAFSTAWAIPGIAAAGDGLPTPPKQAEPWSPPATRLPRFLVSATRTLCEQGLADPRGCDYRAIEVNAGNARGAGGGRVATHGWVLPRAKDRDEDFAVCWNGLVYPVIGSGEKADLDADIRALVDAVRASRAEAQKSGRGTIPTGFVVAIGGFSEVQSAAVEQPLPIKLCLLLRLGRADLAESFFAAATMWTPEGNGRDLTDYGITYLTLASDWAWYVFDRAVGAHILGDDRIALADSRLLVEARGKIEARASAMGFARPRRGVDDGHNHPYLNSLGQLDALHEDQERRAREPHRGAIPPPGADPAARIAALIRDFDQIAERQIGQFGGAGLADSAVVQAVAAEGEAAVGPLLRVLESDTRLTRSAASGGGFRYVRERRIHGVHEAAYSALSRILRARNFGDTPDITLLHGDLEARRKLAGSIRAYWEKNKGVSPAERWYRTLLDDSATLAQWQEAASRLVLREGEDVPGLARPIVGPGAGRPGVAVPLQGEALRTRREPSVSALIARRALDLARPDREPRPGEAFPLDTACNLALALRRWDPDAARPVLSRLMERCNDELTGKVPSRAPARRQPLLNDMLLLAQARAASGDLEALDQAAEIVRRLTVNDVTNPPRPLLDLMAAHPKHPALATAADWLFNDPRSPWMAELRRQHFHLLMHPWYLRPDLLAVGGFRRRLEALLNDTSVAGTVAVREQNNTRSIELRWTDEAAPGRVVARRDPSAPGPKYEGPFRVCDYLAWQLTFRRFTGMPEFQLDWPQPRRDEALDACRESLKRLGQ